MKVQLLYRVPVAVVVDIETRTVERVVVLDEEVSRDVDAEAWDHEASRSLPDGHPAIDEAIELAETEEWPGWEAGW